MASNIIKAPIGSRLKKTPTGIDGFDEIISGGLPKGRPTIITGNSGCGKTVMAMEFLVKGVVKYNDPGVFMSFEETKEDLISNMESLHFDLANLINKKKIYIEYLEIDKAPVVNSGGYDLDGLFARLQNAIDKVGAKRVVLDSLDSLFFGYDKNILRQEIKRLFKWLKEKRVTAVITSQLDHGFQSSDGLEQYVAECVVALDNRVINQTATRRLRIVKMRGSIHGINEYPYLIDSSGMSVLPLFAQLKDHPLSTNRITSGIQDLDGMLDGKGYFRGSSILVSGSAGTGKTSVAISLINETCNKKIRSLYCAFEESSSQITRNMRSIGLNIDRHVKSGLLMFYASRPTIQNLELHLISIRKIIDTFKPEVLVLDPITNMMSEGINSEIRQMLANFVDYLKAKNITTLFTAAITLETIKSNPSDEGISAMVDTWILVSNVELNSERNRVIYVLKSRGMNHSTQVREFVITDKGINLLPIYISNEGILTGTSKLENTLQEEEDNHLRQIRFRTEKARIDRKRTILDADILKLKEELAFYKEALDKEEAENDLKEKLKNTRNDEIQGLRNRTKSSNEKSKGRNK
ncbi:MAG: circadian clock protein KaiC [Chitinophagaceae bacterium]